MDKIKLSAYKATLMKGRPTRASKVTTVIHDLTIAEMDAELRRIIEQYATWTAIRNAKADVVGDKSAPPTIPNLSRPGVATTVETRKRPASLLEEPEKLSVIAGSSVDIALKIIDAHPAGMSAADFRSEYAKIAAGSSPEIDRSYYRPLAKLKRTHHVVLYKGRLFIHRRLQQFLENVASGSANGIVQEPKQINSKWASAVLECLNRNKEDWTHFRDIIDHLSKHHAFADGPNIATLTAVALRNLLQRELIEKKQGRGRGLYRAKRQINGEDGRASTETIRAVEDDTSAVRH
jgi:hypothetical protein